MKVSFIFILLYVHAHASFLREFRSAMANLERGFGKLIDDVVTDVKDTIHCTVSAVEDVLVVNGIVYKRLPYNNKCNNIGNSNHRKLDYPKHKMRLSHELEKSIKNVEKTISSITDSFKQETSQLSEISNILKHELENMSKNVKDEIKHFHFDYNKLNIEPIEQKIRILHEIQEKSKNIAAINEIRGILHKVATKTDLKSNMHHTSDLHKLDEIMETLQKYSTTQGKNNAGNQPFIETSKKSKESNESSPRTYEVLNRNEQNVVNKTSGSEQTHKQHVSKSSSDSSQTSLFNSILDHLKYITPFASPEAITDKVMHNAKKIIEDSQKADTLLESFFKGQQGGDSVFKNVFDES